MSIIKRKAGSEDIVKSVLEFDEVPTEGSHNLVESGAVAQAIGNLGKPLQWKGPATVAELNAGITGIQEGWTYTLTDAGTLTDGSVAVEIGDEVAWTEDGEWFKVGSETAKVKILYGSSGNPPAITFTDMIATISKGYYVILDIDDTFYPFIGSDNFKPMFSNGTDKYTLDLLNTWSKTDFAAIGSVKNGGSVAQSDGYASVENNSLTTITGVNVAALEVSVSFGNGSTEVPNFALEIDPTVDCTLTLKRYIGSSPLTLTPSVAGGNVMTAGKHYQVTCVGSYWTLAEFAMPS